MPKRTIHANVGFEVIDHKLPADDGEDVQVKTLRFVSPDSGDIDDFPLQLESSKVIAERLLAEPREQDVAPASTPDLMVVKQTPDPLRRAPGGQPPRAQR